MKRLGNLILTAGCAVIFCGLVLVISSAHERLNRQGELIAELMTAANDLRNRVAVDEDNSGTVTRMLWKRTAMPVDMPATLPATRPLPLKDLAREVFAQDGFGDWAVGLVNDELGRPTRPWFVPDVVWFGGTLNEVVPADQKSDFVKAMRAHEGELLDDWAGAAADTLTDEQWRSLLAGGDRDVRAATVRVIGGYLTPGGIWHSRFREPFAKWGAKVMEIQGASRYLSAGK